MVLPLVPVTIPIGTSSNLSQSSASGISRTGQVFEPLPSPTETSSSSHRTVLPRSVSLVQQPHELSVGLLRGRGRDCCNRRVEVGLVSRYAQFKGARRPRPFVYFGGRIECIDRCRKREAHAADQVQCRKLRRGPVQLFEQARHIVRPERNQTVGVLTRAADIENGPGPIEEQAGSGQSASIEKLHDAASVALFAGDAHTALVADDFEIVCDFEIEAVREIDGTGRFLARSIDPGA